MSDLRSEINSLLAAQKADLLDTVWGSLEADSASLTDAQAARRTECAPRRHLGFATRADPY